MVLGGTVIALLFGGIGWVHGYTGSREELGSIIEMQAIPATGVSGEHTYTGIVWTEPDPNGLSVHARVSIGSSLGRVEYHELVGKIGTVRSREEAIRVYGVVSWDTNYVYFGPEPLKGHRISRNQLERHR